MPAGRCCSKAGSTGSRWASRPRTWISSRPSTPPRARSRSPSACRRCCSAFPATTPMPTTTRPTARFWRQTVLPLVDRTAKALSGWLAPALRRGRAPRACAPISTQIEALARRARGAVGAGAAKPTSSPSTRSARPSATAPVEGGDELVAAPHNSASWLADRASSGSLDASDGMYVRHQFAARQREAHHAATLRRDLAGARGEVRALRPEIGRGRRHLLRLCQPLRRGRSRPATW